MKFPILFLLSFTTLYSSATAQESNDFLVRLVFNISETRVPNYVVRIIYDRPLGGVEVSTQNVFDLFRVNDISLNTTLEVLRVLNISSDAVFSINGLKHTLEALNWSFTSFYNNLTLNLGLTGMPLRNALVALDIEVNDFLAGIASTIPDPWTEFIKGNFSQEHIESATKAAGISPDILFNGVLKLITDDLVTWKLQRLVELFRNHSIDQPEAVIIWNTLNVTLEDVYNVPVLRDILSNLRDRINNQSTLGVITSQLNIHVNRRAYDIFGVEKELVDIFAETLVTRRMLLVTGINETLLPYVVQLSHSTSGDNVTAIPIAYVDNNLTNCTYVTAQNDIAQSVDVEQAVFSNFTFLVPRNITNNVVVGSALVCNNSVYGLAREAVGESVVFDSFADFNAVNPPTPPPHSSSNILRVTGYLNVFILMYVVSKLFGL